MLMIPGLWHTAHIYDAIASSITNNYRVVAVTRREHGTSYTANAPSSSDAYASQRESGDTVAPTP